MRGERQLVPVPPNRNAARSIVLDAGVYSHEKIRPVKRGRKRAVKATVPKLARDEDRLGARPSVLVNSQVGARPQVLFLARVVARRLPGHFRLVIPIAENPALGVQIDRKLRVDAL